MKQILAIMLLISAGLLQAAPDPAQIELQNINRQLQELRTKKETEKAAELMKTTARNPKMYPRVRVEMYRNLLSQTSRWQEAEALLKESLSAFPDAETRMRLYGTMMGRSGYLFHKDRLTAGQAIVEMAEKDPALSSEQKLNILLDFAGRHMRSVSAREVYGKLRAYPLPVKLEKGTVFSYTRLLSDYAVRRTVSWVSEPTPAGYEDACRILTDGIGQLEGDARLQLQILKGQYLRKLGKYREAEDLAADCLNGNPSMPFERKSSLIAIRAGCLLDQEKFQEAYDLYGTIGDGKEMRPHYEERAKAAMALGNYPETLRLLELYQKYNRPPRSFAPRFNHVKSLVH